MGRKYVCDNCGEISDDPESLVIVELYEIDKTSGDLEHIGRFGEFCDECMATLKKFRKDGFAKGAK